MDGFRFWTMHAIIIALGAVVLLAFAFLFRKLLAPTAEEAPPAAGAAPAPA
jgi:hypothetical protein